MSSYRSTRSLSRLADERMLWSGRPGGGLLFRPIDLLLIPFSLLWCSFAIFWEWGVSTSGAPLFFRLWGVPFVLVGLYFVFGRFIIDMIVRRATCYELTNRRIIIERRGLFARTTTLFLSDMLSLSLKLRGSGRGTIRLGEDEQWWGLGRGMQAWSPALDRAPQLLNIERAEAVFDMIQRGQNEHWQRPV